MIDFGGLASLWNCIDNLYPAIRVCNLVSTKPPVTMVPYGVSNSCKVDSSMYYGGKGMSPLVEPSVGLMCKCRILSPSGTVSGPPFGTSGKIVVSL